MRTIDDFNALGVRVAYDFWPVRESVVGCEPGSAAKRPLAGGAD